jgi:hypothetical protein
MPTSAGIPSYAVPLIAIVIDRLDRFPWAGSVSDYRPIDFAAMP